MGVARPKSRGGGWSPSPSDGIRVKKGICYRLSNLICESNAIFQNTRLKCSMLGAGTNAREIQMFLW